MLPGQGVSEAVAEVELGFVRAGSLSCGRREDRHTEATQRLEIELPEKLADWVRAQVESGRFASESEAVASALVLMEDEEPLPADPEVDDWLRSHVVPTYRAWQANGDPGLTVDEVHASLARRRAERQRSDAAE